MVGHKKTVGNNRQRNPREKSGPGFADISMRFSMQDHTYQRSNLILLQLRVRADIPLQGLRARGLTE
jgi:hypothetical protein